MFYFRLNKVTIADNGDGKLFKLFGHDRSKIQFISLITTEVSLPDLGDIVTETDAAKRSALIKTAAAEVASSVVFTPIDKIKDKAEITFGATGTILYQSKAIPDSFSWEFLCVKLNQTDRDLGKELLGVINDTDFDSVAADIPKLVGTAVSPVYTAGVAIGKFVVKAFMNHLANKKDKQLGILETSFIRQFDYKYGNREDVGVHDEQDNLRIDYSLLGYEENASSNLA